MGTVLNIDYLQQKREPPAAPQEDKTLRDLVNLVYQTNMSALNKSITAIGNLPRFSNKEGAEFFAGLAKKMCAAAHEVAMTLPPEQR